MISANFDFLKVHEPQLVRLGAQAERYFGDDPNTCLIKLRQFGELLAQLTAAKAGLLHQPGRTASGFASPPQIRARGSAPRSPISFTSCGSPATRRRMPMAAIMPQALTTLKIARAAWRLVSTEPSSTRHFKSGPFVPPADPAAATKALHEEMARLRQTVDEFRSAAEKARITAEAEAQARLNAEERREREREERALWEQLADEAEQAKLSLAAQLQTLQAAAAAAPPQATAAIIAQAEAAAAAIDIDEAATRDPDRCPSSRARLGRRYSNAALQRRRHGPAKGRNMAIAEWPTKSGPADYALFVGTRCIAVVEAKRQNKNVSASIDQAQRYCAWVPVRGGRRGYRRPVGRDTKSAAFLVPFVFSANGRPYLKQIETQSGIWFRDARKPTNHRRALVDWPTPDGLQGLLEIDADAAQADLEEPARSISDFPLRPYQKRAIEKVEEQTGRQGARTCCSPWRPAPAKPSSRLRCSTGCWPRSVSAGSVSSWTGTLSERRPPANSRPRAS